MGNNDIVKFLSISEHMRDFGLYMVAEGVKNAVIAPFDQPYIEQLSLTNVVHGTEIILKARIVEEHPLLIFDKIPSSGSINNEFLEFEDLLEKGKTISYFDIPERLWAACEYKIKHIDKYQEIGKIRNQLIPLAVPSNKDLSDLTLKFVFAVIVPAIEYFWKENIFDYIKDDQESVEYVQERLNILKINYRSTF